jgi:hypothetical protein
MEQVERRMLWIANSAERTAYGVRLLLSLRRLWSSTLGKDGLTEGRNLVSAKYLAHWALWEKTSRKWRVFQ